MTDSHGIRVKICGLTNADDASHAARCGADFLGFVLFPGSKRHISLDRATEVVAGLRPHFPETKTVAVTVNATDEEVAAIRDSGAFDFLQLHGSESVERVGEIQRGSALPVIKALSVGQAGDAHRWAEYTADFLLCDTHAPGISGGTGRRFDLSMLPADIPRNRLFLAGGLNAANVAEAIRLVVPYAVDVASGVEASPGRKDPVLVQRFIDEARRVARELAPQ